MLDFQFKVWTHKDAISANQSLEDRAPSDAAAVTSFWVTHGPKGQTGKTTISKPRNIDKANDKLTDGLWTIAKEGNRTIQKKMAKITKFYEQRRMEALFEVNRRAMSFKRGR